MEHTSTTSTIINTSPRRPLIPAIVKRYTVAALYTIAVLFANFVIFYAIWSLLEYAASGLRTSWVFWFYTAVTMVLGISGAVVALLFLFKMLPSGND